MLCLSLVSLVSLALAAATELPELCRGRDLELPAWASEEPGGLLAFDRATGDPEGVDVLPWYVVPDVRGTEVDVALVDMLPGAKEESRLWDAQAVALRIVHAESGEAAWISLLRFRQEEVQAFADRVGATEEALLRAGWTTEDRGDTRTDPPVLTSSLSDQSIETKFRKDFDTDGDGIPEQVKYRTVVTWRRAGESSEKMIARHEVLCDVMWERGFYEYE